MTVPLFMLFPILSYIEAWNSTLLWIAMMTVSSCSLVLVAGGRHCVQYSAQLMIIRQSLGAASFTSIMVVMANSCPGEHVGTLFGVAQSVVSLARGVGPVILGVVWSALAASALPGHMFLIFSSLAVFAGVTFVMGLKLPPSLRNSLKPSAGGPAVVVAVE
jgi:MFS family permease